MVALHVVKIACERPEQRGRALTTWDCAEIAREVVRSEVVEAISPSTVQRILAHHKLKPWRIHLWLSPKGSLYCDDFCQGPIERQGLFIHEMTHIWQHQQGVNLIVRRHPFCRYGYTLRPGWALQRYGIEQQAEIVRHYWLLTQGRLVGGAPDAQSYRAILPAEWGAGA